MIFAFRGGFRVLGGSVEVESQNREGVDVVKVGGWVNLTGAVNPDYYKFPGGAEVKSISGWLTANAAQALQYIARSSRIDGKNKGNTVDDLKKAKRFIDFELERLEQATH